MSRKKQYKNRLPTVLPPAPRPAPAVESVPPEPAPRPEPGSEPGPEPEPAPQAEAEPQPGSAPGPEPDPNVPTERLWEEAPLAPSRARTTAVLLVLVAVVAVGGLVAVRLLVGAGGDDEAAPESSDGPVPAAAPVRPGRSRVEATVRPDGDILVTQEVSSRTALSAVSLAVPDVGATATVTATDVRVEADGEAVAGPDRVAGPPAEFTLDGATSLVITYRLVGAVQGSGSAPGRALALATALDVRWTPGPERETRVVRAPGVLALACTSSPDQPPVPCGSSLGEDTWHVELRGDGVGDRVLAQVTVPGLGGDTPG